MLTSKVITNKLPEVKRVKEILKSEFCPREMAPWWFLIKKAKKANNEFLAFYDGDDMVGIIFLVTLKRVKKSDIKKDITYVLYFAVDPMYHSKGYGSSILTEIEKRYSENLIWLTVEPKDESAKNSVNRVRRIEFYKKNNLIANGLKIKMRDMPFDVLVNNKDDINLIDIHICKQVQRYFLGAIIYPFYAPKEI